jgi:Tfp pilus assembly protein PilE
MPSSHNQYRPSYRFNRRRKPTFLGEKINEPNNKQENPNSEQKESAKINDNRKGAKWAEPAIIVAIVGILASIAMTVYTALLFNETVRQRKLTEQSTQAAINASNEAKRANNHAIYKDSISHIEDSIKIIFQNEKDSNVLVLSQHSLRTQVNAIKQGHEEFLIANEPAIFVSDFRFQILEPYKVPVLQYRIFNAGIYRATIIRGRFGMDFDNDIPNDPFDDPKTIKELKNQPSKMRFNSLKWF